MSEKQKYIDEFGFLSRIPAPPKFEDLQKLAQELTQASEHLKSQEKKAARWDKLVKLTSQNGFWLSCLDDKVIIARRTKTKLGNDLAEAVDLAPDEWIPKAVPND